MTPENLKNEITEYLSEQEIPYLDNEGLKNLCMKAAIEGYSFSDEMYETETAEFIPTDEEVEAAKSKINEPRLTGCTFYVVAIIIILITVL